MAKVPPDDTKDKDKTSSPPYQIKDFLEINLGGLDKDGIGNQNRIKGSTSLYSGTNGLRANRRGYATLNAVDFKTHAPVNIFYLPLPENFYAPLDLLWSENNEEGMADFFARASTGGVGDAAADATSRKLLSMAREKLGQTADAFLRMRGLAYNPNKQLYFDGVSLGTAQWSFNLVPKNRTEANIMYISAQYMMYLATPGANGPGIGDIVNELMGTLGEIFKADDPDPSSAEIAKKRDAMAEKVAKEMQTRKENAFYIPPSQPAFFEYPMLWDFTVYFPKKNGDYRRVFQWKRLAVTSFRINFGSDPKWHDDGLPMSIGLEIGVQETIVRTSATMPQVMPSLII